MLTKLFIHIHRILGLILCILCFSWFISGIVMIYHSFPRVSQEDRFTRAEILDTNGLPAIQDVLLRLPAKTPTRGLSLNNPYGDPIFSIGGGRQSVELYADTNVVAPVINYALCENRAARWCADRKITRVDTLYALDQWIPLAHYKREFPIYKFYFDGPEKYQLYVSSRTANILQFTDSDNRFWAWFGAIPHWVYFTWLRQDATLWSKTVIWLSGIGCLMVIAGIWVTVDVWRRTRKSHRQGFSPYRKKWYHWHYLSGIFFGIFVLTFTFSGMMSVADIPEWIHKPALKSSPLRTLQAKAPQPEDYTLDYRTVITSFPEVRQIEWSNFRKHPYYTVKDGKGEQYIDATDSVPHTLQLQEKEIREGVESVYAADSIPAHQRPELHMTLLNHFETYYRDMSSMYRGRSQLPVWKITVDDSDRSVFYIHPETGIIRYVNTSSRWKYWSYTAMHRMRLPGLNSNTTLRKTVLWILLLGGTVTSVTGIVLSINYVRRKCRKKQKRLL